LLTQTAGQLELGTGAALSAGTVAINGGVLLADGPAAAITADLIYDSSSPSSYQGILAGAGNSLTVNNPGALLVLSGSNTYQGGTYVAAGTLIAVSPTAIRDATNLTIGDALMFAAIDPATAVTGQSPPPTGSALPEPGTLALLAAAVGVPALAGCRRRCRRSSQRDSARAGVQR
jgi:autotransporter-associated beta strand protein